jgi:hypothetical protein
MTLFFFSAFNPNLRAEKLCGSCRVKRKLFGLESLSNSQHQSVRMYVATTVKVATIETIPAATPQKPKLTAAELRDHLRKFSKDQGIDPPPAKTIVSALTSELNRTMESLSGFKSVCICLSVGITSFCVTVADCCED